MIPLITTQKSKLLHIQRWSLQHSSQYGYLEDGVMKGSGGVGAFATYDNQNFYRDSFEINLEHEFRLGRYISHTSFWCEVGRR